MVIINTIITIDAHPWFHFFYCFDFDLEYFTCYRFAIYKAFWDLRNVINAVVYDHLNFLIHVCNIDI